MSNQNEWVELVAKDSMARAKPYDEDRMEGTPPDEWIVEHEDGTKEIVDHETLFDRYDPNPGLAKAEMDLGGETMDIDIQYNASRQIAHTIRLDVGENDGGITLEAIEQSDTFTLER